MKRAALIVICLLSGAAARAQDAPADPVAIIHPADIDKFNEIIAMRVPPAWSRPMVEWLNNLIARQKAEAESAKQKQNRP
jgi:hypothetical protein